MMTVLDEVRNMGKYDHLLFVEFLDFLCRVALAAVPHDLDTFEYRVQKLLEVLFEYLYEDE